MSTGMTVRRLDADLKAVERTLRLLHDRGLTPDAPPVIEVRRLRADLLQRIDLALEDPPPGVAS